MATLDDLATRTLQKLQVLGVDQAAPAADLQKAIEKVRAVHAFLKAEKLLRWTFADVPDYAEEPYILMAAYLGSPDFQVERDPEGWRTGLTMIQAAVNLPAVGRVQAEYF